MGDAVILGLLALLVLVQVWRLRLEKRWHEEAVIGTIQTHVLLTQVNERLAGLIEIEASKAQARAQLRTLVKGEGRTLLRERLKAHLGG